MPTLVIVTPTALPVVPTATAPKSIAAGATLAAGASAAAIALPDSVTDALPPLLATASVADFAPVVAGANRTVALHDCPAASTVPAEHVPPREKSAAAAPPSAIDESVSVPPPPFATVTVCCALCVPTSWSA